MFRHLFHRLSGCRLNYLLRLLLSGRHRPGLLTIGIEAGNGFADQPLNRVEVFAVLGRGKRQGPARHAGPARAADAVDVIVGMNGNVIEKNVA